MTPRPALARLRDRLARSEAGSATIEFVIGVPLILSLLFSSIDYGVVMLRQVFLDRAVDIAVRQVRLGAVPANGHAAFRAQICANTFMITDCEDAIAIELRPIDTTTWAGLDTPAQCVNRAADIEPTLQFTPSPGTQALMLVRVCVAADPFITMTGMILGLSRDDTGDYLIVAKSAFANEPA